MDQKESHPFSKAWWWLVLLLILVGLFFLGLAAWHSLPGSSLYPLKTEAENIKTATALNELTRASDHVDQANQRLGELKKLYTDNPDSPYLPQVIADMGYQDQQTMYVLVQAKGDNLNIGPDVDKFCDSLDSQQAVLTKDFDAPIYSGVGSFTAAAAQSTLDTVNFGISAAQSWGS